MRVVLVTHRTHEWLGVNKYFYLLGKHLAQFVDVSIIVDSAEGLLAARSICGDSVTIVCLSPTALGVVATARYCANLSRYLRGAPEVDVLHCGHILPFFYLQDRVRNPVVFQPFGNELFTLAGRGMNRLYCKLAQPILRYCGEHADVLLMEGAFQEAEMRRYYPKAKALATLAVGVDNIISKAHYTTDGRFQFLAVNSLLAYEAMDELIQAFGMIHNDGMRLTIVGTGAEESKLRNMARGLPVRFEKNLWESKLYSLYRESDAFVCTSYEKDVQMGILEAMATGLPVLARDAKWLPGSVIRFRDRLELTDGMSRLFTTSALKRRKIGNRGLDEVKAYSFTDIAQQALNIYKEIAI